MMFRRERLRRSGQNAAGYLVDELHNLRPRFVGLGRFPVPLLQFEHHRLVGLDAFELAFFHNGGVEPDIHSPFLGDKSEAAVGGDF